MKKLNFSTISDDFISSQRPAGNSSGNSQYTRPDVYTTPYDRSNGKQIFCLHFV